MTLTMATSIHAPKKKSTTLNGDSGWPPSGPSRTKVISSIRHDRDVEMEDVPAAAAALEVEADFGRDGNDESDQMEWEQTISQSTHGLAYLALDTNILINQLGAIKQLHDRLIHYWPPSLLFLIPNTVINELDRHSRSEAPARATAPPLPRGISVHSPAAKQYARSQTQPTTLGKLAREATAWLLQVGQQRRERGWGLVRCQQWVERTQKDLTKADDKILDCCVHFAKFDQHQAAVWLWTDDRNLKVQAEAHDIPTIGNSLMTPDSILARCSPTHPARGPQPKVNGTISAKTALEETMELDMDFYEDNTSIRHHDRHSVNSPRHVKSIQALGRRSSTSVAKLGLPVWTELTLPDEEGPVCVTCSSSSHSGNIAIWANVDEMSDELEACLPHSAYDNLASADVHLERHNPLSLTTVFLQPSDPDELRPNLDDFLLVFPPLIFRQGGSVSIPAGRYKVLLTEPVLQGCITSETQLVVANAATVAEADDMGEEMDGSSATSRHSLADFDPDAFLSSSLSLAGPTTDDQDEEPSASFYSTSSSDFDSQSGSVTPRPGPNSPTAIVKQFDVDGDAPAESHRGTSVGFIGVPAATRCPLSETGDADSSCWLGLGGLGRAGVFAGDWVLLENSGGQPASRLALVNVLRPKSELEEPVNQLVLPPLVLTSITGFSEGEIRLRPTTFGSRLPDLPIARSITLARIASAESVDRSFEESWVSGLRNYFVDAQGNSLRKLARRGDVIGIPVRQGQKDEDEEEVFNSQSTAAVFFIITAVSFDPLLPLESDFSSSLSSRARAGEFGCWIDGAQTRMVQLGVERARSCRGSLGWWGVDDVPKPFSIPARTKLQSLLESSLSPSALAYGLNLSVLIKGAGGSGKSSLAQSVARDLGFHLVQADCFAMVGDTDAVTEGTLQAIAEKAVSCAPSVLLLKHVEALARKSESLSSGQEPAIAAGLRAALALVQAGMKQAGWPVVVVATTSDEDKVPAEILSVFKQQVAIKAPSESERHSILDNVFASVTLGPDVSLKALAVQTAALQARDCVNLGAKARECSLQRVALAIGDATWDDVYRSGVAVSAADIELALQQARAAYSDSIGAPKIPNVTWDDVGGLANVKTDILDTIQLPLEHPELFADGLKKRSGILLYGPPGTGKTLLAKAVATSCSLNFFSVKGPELLNMYIGESEANVRRVFQRARDAKPCVIFMDELDSVAPKRGNQGDSGGVMDRIVSQLLAELDGMSGDGDGGDGVYVMAATNRPDLLDPALLRPGRFDRMLYLGVSDTHESQLKIIQALTRKFKLDPDVDLETLANACPFNYTGADFYALCSDALLKAMARKAEAVDAKIAAMNANGQDLTSSHPYPMTPQYYLSVLATPSEIDVSVSQTDFERALDELVPSVSQGEMEHYKRVQSMFSAETINSR